MLECVQALVVGVRLDDVGEMPARRLQVVVVAHDTDVSQALRLRLRQAAQRCARADLSRLPDALDAPAPVFDLVVLGSVPAVDDAERIRAGGAGIPAFFTPAAVGTPLAAGKESRVFDGKQYLMERWLKADFALIKGRSADSHGNVVYNKTARNFGPIMAMAAKVSIVQVASAVLPGQIDPEVVVTPGIFIDRVVEVPNPLHESELVAAGASYP